MSTERTLLAAELQQVIARKAAPGKLSWIGKLAEALGVTARHSDALAERLAAIEARVAVLESAPIEMCGIHAAGRAYRKGQLTIHSGSLWFCRVAETVSTPGQSPDWLLCVKRARFTEGDR